MIWSGSRQSKPERRLDTRLGLDEELPLVGLHYRATDRQPHAHPIGTGAEIGVKDPIQLVRRNTFTIVANSELHAVQVGGPRPDNQCGAWGLRLGE
jgi:hypothetical protein